MTRENFIILKQNYIGLNTNEKNYVHVVQILQGKEKDIVRDVPKEIVYIQKKVEKNGETMRILTIQERIELGQAKNQTTQILSRIWLNIIPSDRKGTYKKMVKEIYLWNTELDTEIMETGKEQQQPSSKLTSFEPQQDSQSPSNYPEHPIKKFGGRI